VWRVKMADGSAVLEKARQFASEDNSVAGEAARDFVDALAGYIKRKKFNSGDFYDDVVSFLAIEAEQLNEMDEEVITKFLETCRRKNALDIVRRFSQICISPWFNISIEKLGHIATVVAKIGLKEESASIFNRASAKVLAEEAE